MAVAVLMRLRMACVGCPMARFETLAEAAASYRLSSEVLLEAMEDDYQREGRGHDRQADFTGSLRRGLTRR